MGDWQTLFERLVAGVFFGVGLWMHHGELRAQVPARS
jgi:hypothetical protein